MMTDYRPPDRAVWSETTCKAWIASGAIVPPEKVSDRSLYVLGIIFALIASGLPLGFLWGLLT